MSIHEKNFLDAYNRLNSEQKQAVDAIDGPVMVIAGPGTGKTQILTLRIAHILRKTDVGPESILALTFTEAGARAMRERLHAYIGQVAHRVHIYTFHEFSGRLIRSYPDSYARAVGGRPATDLEKISLIKEIIETGHLRHLRPHGNPSFYIKPIMSAIALMKREYITPEAFTRIIESQEQALALMERYHEKGAHAGKVRGEYQKQEKELEKNRELLYVYRTYDTLLSAHNLYDFEDMIFETVRALETDENMLRDLQERFQYILADEHQDVNGSQNRILELLASFHERPNIFVVGDEKQAIFRFQGASLENFLYFEDVFPHTTTIALTSNYRSVQKILDFSHALITQVESPASALRVALNAVKEDDGIIEKSAFSHEAVEDNALVEKVITCIDSGVRHKEIVIIVRSNREVEAYASMLRARNIAVNATADGDILHHPITASVRTMINAVIEPSNEVALMELLHGPQWGIERADLVRICRARTFEYPLAHILENEDFLTGLKLSNQIAVANVVRVLTEARARSTYEAPHRVLGYVLRESGFIDYVIARNGVEGGRVIRRLYDEIESLVCAHETSTLSDVAQMFATRIEHKLPLNAPYIHTNTEAVNVMTAHKSKGLEFEHVFIPHLTDAQWGDTTRPTYFTIPISKRVSDDDFDALDDERKLLYVALTRAKIGLHLSFSRGNKEGRSFLETPLLDDMPPTGVVVSETEPYEKAFDPLELISSKDVQIPIDTALLQTALREYGLSATALNNYLRSPWDYLYRNVLRIPELKSESAEFGTVLHNTLRRCTQYRTEHGILPSATLLKTYLECELKQKALSVHEYTRFHERGLVALSNYLATVGERLPPKTQEEVRFEARLSTQNEAFPEVLLTGNLDRLDYDTDGNLLCIVDYKSGKPKTRGYIEGTTKDSTGDYKRQLTFYALLLSLQHDERFHTRNGTLSFVETDDKGKTHEEPYTITDDEIQSLKEKILLIVNEIVHGDFLDAPCDATQSDYCHLVELLREGK